MSEYVLRNGDVLRVETEQIEITRNGMFGGPADVIRRFMPGMTTYTLIAKDGSERELAREEYAALLEKLRLGRSE